MGASHGGPEFAVSNFWNLGNSYACIVEIVDKFPCDISLNGLFFMESDRTYFIYNFFVSIQYAELKIPIPNQSIQW